MPLSDVIPEPTIVLTGCRPWDARLRTPGGCPVCRGGIRAGDDSIHCARCDSSSPRREAQIRTARIGLRARAQVEIAEREAREHLHRKSILTESERRRLWNGYRGGLLRSRLEVTNRAKVGREWLKSIGQEPDFSLILDKRGRVVGRVVPPADE